MGKGSRRPPQDIGNEKFVQNNRSPRHSTQPICHTHDTHTSVDYLHAIIYTYVSCHCLVWFELTKNLLHSKMGLLGSEPIFLLSTVNKVDHLAEGIAENSKLCKWFAKLKGRI